MYHKEFLVLLQICARQILMRAEALANEIDWKSSWYVAVSCGLSKKFGIGTGEVYP